MLGAYFSNKINARASRMFLPEVVDPDRFTFVFQSPVPQVKFRIRSRQASENLARACAFRQNRQRRLGFDKLLRWVFQRSQSTTMKSGLLFWHWGNVMRRMLRAWSSTKKCRKIQALVDSLVPPTRPIVHSMVYEDKFILRLVWANWSTRATVSRIERARMVGKWVNTVVERNRKKEFMAYWKERQRGRKRFRNCVISYQARYWRMYFDAWVQQSGLSPQRVPLLLRWRIKRSFTTWKKSDQTAMGHLCVFETTETKEQRAIKHFKRQLMQRFFVLWRVSWWVWSGRSA